MFSKQFLIAGLTSAAISVSTSAWAQGSNLPWGVSSDQIAWETFTQVVSPAGQPGKKLVVFETWASDQDLYATNPPTWPSVNAPKRLQPIFVSRIRDRHHFRSLLT
jgi:hypothetical protein